MTPSRAPAAAAAVPVADARPENPDGAGLGTAGAVEAAPPSAAPQATSALAPFRHRLFAAMWGASLVSHCGGLIQGVGASWLMISLAPSADMVALVQVSTVLPIMLFSLPAGAAADLWDRRTVMLVAQVGMLAISAVLAGLAWLGLVTPFGLLALTFLLGCGAALYGPAWQSSVREQVPRADLPAAVALNSAGFNLARAVGPRWAASWSRAPGPRPPSGSTRSPISP